MEQTVVRISAEPSQYDNGSCRFHLDRALHRGFARFTSAERAKGSPLAERLFAIEGVSGVMIQGQDVTVSVTPPVNWREKGPLVGQAIRAHVQSGEAAISAEALQNAPAEDLLREKVIRILEEQINPAIASHGGMISLLDVQGSTLYIKMGGGCQGCSQADVTLRQGVETSLREQIPEIGQILDVTDHAGGANPYYSAH
jgi:NFU1 iron-sulfur cluster scaffold homolog, mitochondrial